MRRCIRTDFLFGFYFTLELYWQRTWENIDADVKRFIFEHLQKHEIHRESGFDYNELKKFLACKDDLRTTLLMRLAGVSRLNLITANLFWLVATDICFYSDPKKHQDLNSSEEYL